MKLSDLTPNSFEVESPKQAAQPSSGMKLSDLAHDSYEIEPAKPRAAIPAIDPTAGLGVLGGEYDQFIEPAAKVIPSPGAVNAFLESQRENIPIIGPALERAGAGIGEALGLGSSQQILDDNMLNAQERAKEYPKADFLGGVSGRAAMATPAGLLPNLGVSAADIASRAALKNQDIQSPLDLGNSAANATENLALEAMLGGAAKSLGGLKKANLESRADEAIKDSFNPTVRQIEEMGVKTGKTDEMAKLARESGMFDVPFQSKQSLYDKANSIRQNAFEKSDDILMNESAPTMQSELRKYLNNKAEVANNSWKPELSSALADESRTLGNVVKDLPEGVSMPKSAATTELVTEYDSLGMPTIREVPIDAELSAAQQRAFRESVTEISPDMIRARKTALDKASRDGFGNITDDAKAGAAQELRDFQRSKLGEESRELYDEANKEYGRATDMQKFFARDAAREQGNTLLGKTDRNFGWSVGDKAAETVGIQGVPKVGLAMLGAKGVQIARQYSAPFRAWGYTLGARVAGNQNWLQQLAKAGERSGQAGVASTHFILMQRDPEYREAYTADQLGSKE